jgi:hypothetical protein
MDVNKVKCHGSKFYLKVHKDQGSPMLFAIKRMNKKNHKILIDKQIQNNRMFGSFKCILDIIKLIKDEGNINFYEKITINQSVNLYLDIEFPSTQINPRTAVSAILEYIPYLMNKVFNVNIKLSDVYISGSLGDGKIKSIAVNKASYHIIFHYDKKFKNIKSLKYFMNYVKYKIDNPEGEYESNLVQSLKFILDGHIEKVIDFHVYGNNQSMKLYNQSKYGSNRVQLIIQGNDHKGHFCGVYDDVTYEHFDINNIPKHQKCVQKIMKIQSVVGHNNFRLTGNIHSDFRPNVCIPNEFRSFKLKYIIDSIDNTNQTWSVFFGMCCAIKNAAKDDIRGSKLFLKWCMKSVKYDKDRSLDLWNSIEKRTNGYNKNTLIKLAQRCNSTLIRITPEKIMHDLIYIDPNFTKIIYNEKYVKPYPYTKFKCIIVQSPMGTGKTYQIAQMLKSIDVLNKRILVLAPRRCFAKSITGELNKRHNFNFTCYIDIKRKSSLHEHKHLVCQIESLHYLKSNYDIIIADEIESCLTQFSSVETMKGKIDKVSTRFINIWKNAEFKLLSDAFISPRTLNFICDIEKRTKINNLDIRDCLAQAVHDPYAHILFMKNQILPERRVARELSRIKRTKLTPPIDILQDHLMNSLIEGKKCIFITASKARGFEFLNKIKDLIKSNDLKYKFYHSGNKDIQDDLLNVNQEWIKLQLLMYTSSITVGVNFDIQHFDRLYIYSSCRSSCVRDIFQASMRSRYLNDKILYYQIFEDNFATSDDITSNIDEIRSIIKYKCKRELSFENQMIPSDENMELTNWKLMPHWLLNLHIYNLYEQNISKLNHRLMFNYYLDQCNYDIQNKPNTLELDFVELIPIQFSSYYDITYKIHDIDTLLLKEKQKNELSDYEKNQLQKIKFDKHFDQYSKRSHIYNYFFDPNNFKRNHYFNILFEKRYSLASLSNKEKNDIIFTELSKQKTLKLQVIRSLINMLNVSSTTDGTKSFYAKDLIVLYDKLKLNRTTWFKIFNLRDRSNVKLKNKLANKIAFVSVTLNSILESWSGSKFVRHKIRKNIVIDGIRKKIATYTLLPPLNIDVISCFNEQHV